MFLRADIQVRIDRWHLLLTATLGLDVCILYMRDSWLIEREAIVSKMTINSCINLLPIKSAWESINSSDLRGDTQY